MNKIDLDGHIAIVTGGAQGIGFAVAERLAESGAQVASWDLAESNEAAMEKLGSSGLAVSCDITDWNSVTQALAQTRDALDTPNILVNSAGIAGPNALVEDYALDDWQRVIQINLTGTFHVNRAVLPEMKSANYGRIVNIASIAGKEGNPNASAYSASKAAVIALTKSLGKETAGHDIAVNAVTPAAARTRIFDQMSQEHIDYMLSKIPRNRFLQVEEAAGMIAWLVSPENSFTTGAVFDLSGGRATY
ncbi:SDR family NAD(P)-dependent oxidoreductase [Pelagibius sp. Alg239-R121]|uniref:SDR family NAD(P)-dependent oxidoreductase n=1 Tax=Pelagibius sp. Alg239-R121 TaxID=2993448 RepID=UPI0024A79566|nr:SDR family NAD(P)-dependent oxidoreductase [Pelagibius sp. Alg239-R121]